jgi:hypothetical protein
MQNNQVDPKITKVLGIIILVCIAALAVAGTIKLIERWF